MSAPRTRDETFLGFATPRQAEVLEAIWSEGSQHRAAEKLGISRGGVSRAVTAVTAKARKRGYAPDYDLVNPAPEGFKYKGYSTLRDKRTGEAILQWEKTTADEEARERAVRAAIEAASEEIPRLRPVSAPKRKREDLLNNYVLTDAHIDMLSWREETGADWDIKIAEETLTACMAQLIASAPAAASAVVAQLGDFLHSDGLDAVTPTSGHQLDRDTRFERSVKVAIRTLRRIIDMALAKHEHVTVLMAEGNHDLASSVWLRQIFAALYEHEPRVTVETSPTPYYVRQHGRTMLAYHHGHLRKRDRLEGLFAAQFAKIWGDTDYRYAHVGHLHSLHVREADGMIVTQHQTLAARDAYAARHGYTAERSVECVTYHKNFGRVATNTMRPEMVEKATP